GAGRRESAQRGRRPPLPDRENRGKAERERRGGAAVDESEVPPPFRIDGSVGTRGRPQSRSAVAGANGRVMGRSKSRRAWLIAALIAAWLAHDLLVPPRYAVDARFALFAIEGYQAHVSPHL